MKKFIYLLALILFVVETVQAQDKTDYLVGDTHNISGFGGLMTELSAVNNQAILSFGGGGGALIDQRFFIGGYGMGNLVEFSTFSINGHPRLLEMGHGGLWIGYHHNPQKVVHFGGSARVGFGGLAFTNLNGDPIVNDGFFVTTSQLHVEMNVLPFLKLNLSGGYRNIFGLNNDFVDNRDVSSPTLLFGMYFGWFGE
ncbi:MAG: hypothetical protein WEC59_13110 [Salibacteraceae bacterium]